MRSVPEWIGKTDDAAIPTEVRRRICLAQDFRCAQCTRPFGPKLHPAFDHKVPLWAGGEHRESNLQALCVQSCHKAKTSTEATERASMKRAQKKRLGLHKPKHPIRGWRRMNGEIVWAKDRRR